MRQPHYQKLYSDLKKQVISGIYKHGDLLPSENQLCEQYGITRLTVRNALNMLVHEGYISKQHGKGSLVSLKRNALPLLTFKGFSDTLGKTDIPVQTKELASPKKQRWEKDFFFPLSEKEKKQDCIFFQRLRFAGKDPIMLEYTYVPGASAAGLTQKPLVEQSLFTTLRQRFGIDITGVEQELRAILPDAKTARLLKIKTNAPVIHIYRRYHTYKPQFFVYSSLFCLTDQYALSNSFNQTLSK